MSRPMGNLKKENRGETVSKKKRPKGKRGFQFQEKKHGPVGYVAKDVHPTGGGGKKKKTLEGEFLRDGEGTKKGVREPLRKNESSERGTGLCGGSVKEAKKT